MEDKNKKPVDTQQLKKPTGKSVTGKPLDGIEIRPQLKGLGNRQHNEDTVVLTDTLAEKKALTLVQRQRRARILRAKEPKMQRAKEVAQHKLASDQKLKARAVVKARNIVKMRFAARKGTPYTELTTSEKIQVDKVVDKKVGLIRKLAARLLPSLRKAEVNRLASFQSGAKLQHATAGPVNEEFNNIVESLENKTSMQLVDIISDSIAALNENDNSMGITLKRLLNAVLPEDAATSTLIQKAERTGIPFSTLREVFERGSFAWENDGRTTQEQFSFARVNSYIAKGRAWTLDADLREEKLINDKLDNVFEATYRGKKVPLNKHMKSDVKKSKVYVDPDYHAKVHQDLQWHAGRNRSNSTGAANYHHLITLDDPSHIETYYEKTVHPILKKHNYPTPPEGPGDGGNPKYHAAVQEIIKNWRNEPRWMRNEETEVKEAYHTGLSASTAKKREAHWKKMEKYSDKDDRAYQDAPGDKAARKKSMPQSVHTKKYHAMYGANEDYRSPDMHEDPHVPDINESLWANIHAKRKRIKAGSGERMRKPGEKGAPSAAGIQSAQEAAHKETATQERQEMQYVKRNTVNKEKDVDPPHIQRAHDQIKKKIVDESNREVGTKSLVKKYQKETPGQEKADINEIFNAAFAEDIERRGDFKLVKVRTPKGYVFRKVRREVDIEKDAE